jgi:hypothetical protein
MRLSKHFFVELLQTGDPRLMDDKCHRTKTMGHKGTLEQRFSKVYLCLNPRFTLGFNIGEPLCWNP